MMIEEERFWSFTWSEEKYQPGEIVENS